MHAWFHRSQFLTRSLLISATAVLTGVLGLTNTLFAQAQDAIGEMEAWAADRLPETIISRASEILELPTMVASQLDLATGMVRAGVEMGPNSIPAWEKLRQLSVALRDDLEDAEELELKALAELARLDPGNRLILRFFKAVLAIQMHMQSI